MQLWMLSLSGEVLWWDWKGYCLLLEHAYDIDIRVNPIGDVLEQHLKAAKLLSEARNADYSVMVAVAITETEKDTAVLPRVSETVTSCWDSGYWFLTPTLSRSVWV